MVLFWKKDKFEAKIRWKNDAQAALTLSFDDGYQETYGSTFPILMDRKMTATYSIPTSYVGGRLHGLQVGSWSDWQNAAKSGMEIASHSVRHGIICPSFFDEIRSVTRSLYQERNKLHFLRYVGEIFFSSVLAGKPGKRPGQIEMSLAEIQGEPLNSKKEIDDRIHTQQALSYVYPAGICNSHYKEIVRSAGYLSARSTLRGRNEAASIDFFELRCFMWDEHTSPKEANSWVDFAIRKGAWLIEVYHFVGNKKVSDYPTLVKDLEEHLDYVYSLVKQGMLWVDTQQNVAKYMRERLNAELRVL